MPESNSKLEKLLSEKTNLSKPGLHGRCCRLNCSRPAEWVIYDLDKHVDNDTYSCSECLGEMLTERNRVVWLGGKESEVKKDFYGNVIKATSDSAEEPRQYFVGRVGPDYCVCWQPVGSGGGSMVVATFNRTRDTDFSVQVKAACDYCKILNERGK